MEIPTCPSCRNEHGVRRGTEKNHDVWCHVIVVYLNTKCQQRAQVHGRGNRSWRYGFGLQHHRPHTLRTMSYSSHSVFYGNFRQSVNQSVNQWPTKPSPKARPTFLLCYSASFPNGVIACTTSSLCLSLRCDWRISLLAFFIAFYNQHLIGRCLYAPSGIRAAAQACRR